jgi:hypothetical protein
MNCTFPVEVAMSSTTSHSNGIVIYSGNLEVVYFKLDDLPGGRVYAIREAGEVISVFAEMPAALERVAEMEAVQ